MSSDATDEVPRRRNVVALPSRRSKSADGRSGVVLRAVAELLRERDALARRVEILDGKLVEVTDLLANGKAERAAYERGYSAGYKAKRRGKPTMTPRGSDRVCSVMSEAA